MCRMIAIYFVFFFSSRRRHTRLQGDWSSDVCSSDLIVVRPAEYTIMLKPVHDHTVPKISPRRRVLGVTSQLTSSDLIPSHPKKAGTTPIGYSRTNRRTTPTTMSGVTIPRKMSDLTNEAPRTFCRST